MANITFPGELLSRPPAERLQYFQGFTMAHPQLQDAKDALMTAIEDAAPGSLVFVFGPTGVGKTTLRLRAEQLITQKMLPELDSDPGRLPYVSVEAIAPETGIFSWKEHFRRMLASVDEPLIDSKVSAPEFIAKTGYQVVSGAGFEGDEHPAAVCSRTGSLVSPPEGGLPR